MPQTVGTGSPKAHRKESGMVGEKEKASISRKQGGRKKCGKFREVK